MAHFIPKENHIYRWNYLDKINRNSKKKFIKKIKLYSLFRQSYTYIKEWE